MGRTGVPAGRDSAISPLPAPQARRKILSDTELVRYGRVAGRRLEEAVRHTVMARHMLDDSCGLREDCARRLVALGRTPEPPARTVLAQFRELRLMQLRQAIDSASRSCRLWGEEVEEREDEEDVRRRYWNHHQHEVQLRQAGRPT